jgi:threonyl-tRNA synthetase
MMIHPYSPGSVFFLPSGAKIYHKLVDFIRKQYRARGFTEVITPNIFNKDLWVTSGHWDNYKDNMFALKVDDQEFALKPMNCPGKNANMTRIVVYSHIFQDIA